MKRRFSDGREVLRFEPQELLLRLCTLAPPPHTTCYHGVFAPHARVRFTLTGRGLHDAKPERAPRPPRAIRPKDTQGPDDPERKRRLDWATLLKRTFGVDALV